MLPLRKRSYFIVAILQVRHHHRITLKHQANIFWIWSPKSISACKICCIETLSSSNIIENSRHDKKSIQKNGCHSYTRQTWGSRHSTSRWNHCLCKLLLPACPRLPGSHHNHLPHYICGSLRGHAPDVRHWLFATSLMHNARYLRITLVHCNSLGFPSYVQEPST